VDGETDRRRPTPGRLREVIHRKRGVRDEPEIETANPMLAQSRDHASLVVHPDREV
jgi:hypothetical protein